MYEMNDEMRLVHEHLPHAFMVGIFFLPISSTTDKMRQFFLCKRNYQARGRTGRLDPALGAHSSKADASYVGLYALGDPEDNYSRGAVRFMNVMSDPPRQGRPKVATTLSLQEMVVEFIGTATQGSDSIKWELPEDD